MRVGEAANLANYANFSGFSRVRSPRGSGLSRWLSRFKPDLTLFYLTACMEAC